MSYFFASSAQRASKRPREPPARPLGERKETKTTKIFPKELTSKAEHPKAPAVKAESPPGGRKRRVEPIARSSSHGDDGSAGQTGETECHRTHGLWNSLPFKSFLNRFLHIKSKATGYLLSTVCICLHVTGEAGSSGPQTPPAPFCIYRINDNK